MNKAFTLVELAIVIVIIGLLVSGVLQGQELIKQAIVRAQIKQFSEFDSSALTFKAKYGYIPGDVPTNVAPIIGLNCSNCAPSRPANGSATGGNNILDDADYGTIPSLSARFESVKFFTDMTELKFIKDYVRWSGMNAISVGTGEHFPYAKINNKSGIAAFSHVDGIYYYLGPTITPTEAATLGTGRWYYNSPRPSISPSYAAMIDEKIDNGIPSSGLVRAVTLHQIIAANNFANDTVINNCLGASNQVYNLNSDDLLCRIIVKANVN